MPPTPSPLLRVGDRVRLRDESVPCGFTLSCYGSVVEIGSGDCIFVLHDGTDRSIPWGLPELEQVPAMEGLRQ